MQDGNASQTARRVAAHRLDYERIETPYGDPAADVALARDVADGVRVTQNRMHEYLRARTAFFDRTVVTSIDHRVTQVIVGAAGYDGRAFRYAKHGVRWFEVDHPATQADKRERIGRLGIDARHVRFVAADFATDPVAGLLLSAGLDPREPALFLLEGVAVYLDRPVLERVLGQFREVTVNGSLLAISVSPLHAADAQARDRFQASVAAMGEPARLVLAPEEAFALLAGAGWQVAEGRDRLRPAGLLLARATDASFSAPERSRPSPRPRRLSAPGQARPVTDSLPLPALLSQALVAFTIEFDNEAEHRLPHRTQTYGLSPGAPADALWLTSLAMWANCLRHVPDEGITVGALRQVARTGTNLDGMRRWRYVTFSPDPGHGKRPRLDAVMRPTPRGREARQTWDSLGEVIEARWRERLGADAVDALRSALADVVADLDPALPDCLPIAGYGLFSRLDPDAARPDQGATQPAALPLWALLSKPLLAFAVDYENESSLSLAIGANVIRVLPASGDAVRPRDLPVLSGVSRESIDMAMGILRKRALVAEEPDPSASRGKVIRLTGQGIAAQHAYHTLVAAIEDRWRARFPPGRVAALRATLEPLAVGDPPPLFAAIEPYPDGWRARQRRPQVLPHYPMVLHRGGYPDGS